MTRRNGQARHGNNLKKSSQDVVALAMAVEERFIQLLNGWLQAKGEELMTPHELDGDMLNWRKMRWRHKTGDFRHTDSEGKSLKRIAQWTLVMNAELRGQPVPEWDAGNTL